MKVRVTVDTDRMKKRLLNNVEMSRYLVTQQVLEDSNQYVPVDTWNLHNSAFLHSNLLKDGRIIWNTPYARRMYYGVGYKFSRDLNPKAQAKWYEKAKAVHRSQWRELAAKTMKG